MKRGAREVRVRDFATAARIYGELCDRNEAEACYQLAVLRTAGNGVERERGREAERSEWFEAGHPHRLAPPVATWPDHG